MAFAKDLKDVQKKQYSEEFEKQLTHTLSKLTQDQKQKGYLTNIISVFFAENDMALKCEGLHSAGKKVQTRNKIMITFRYITRSGGYNEDNVAPMRACETNAFWTPDDVRAIEQADKDY